MAETSPNGTLKDLQLPEQVVDRLARMELRIREQDEAARLAETELLAMERDLRVKEAYVRRLERDQQLLSVELAQVRERAAELFADLEAAEERIAEKAAQLAAFELQPAYQVGMRLVAAARRLGPLARLLRRLAGASPERSRP